MPAPVTHGLAPEQAPYLAAGAEVLGALHSDPERGLDDDEAKRRLALYGTNQLPVEAPIPGWRRLLAQFGDSLVLLLLGATLVSFGTWLYEREAPLPYEALAIFAVVSFNALIGYLQEARADAAIASLRQLTAAQAVVLRAGDRRRIPAAQVVPGDILFVEEGDTVAADARVLDATALQAAEAALTGESLPVDKHVEPLPEEAGLGDRTNMVWSGTSITYGRGRAVVTATGPRTEMGRIAALLRAVPEETTPLQRQLDRVGKRLGVAVIAIAAVVTVTIVLIEGITTIRALLDVLILGVALAVAAVPESLPAVVTGVLSIGVQRMARRQAIVRHLSAVETLGSADVIASDKTGTLTKNEMTVRAVVTHSGAVAISGTGYAPEGSVSAQDGSAPCGALRDELELAMLIAERANNAALSARGGVWSIQGDPTEAALIVAACKAGMDRHETDRRWPRLSELPFSSERKLMSTIHRDEQLGGLVLFSKGAPDVMLERCAYESVGGARQALSTERRAEILRQNELLAARGLRTLGLATRAQPAPSEESERDLVFAGLVGMLDPPREEARAAIAQARAAGIRTLMITGDHPTTALVIAKELGMSERPSVATGRELASASEEELDLIVRGVQVFARVDPEHKLRIVRSLMRQGAVVSMTGDGVNDAPALKTANIGVAMGITGTDVSKQAADMILADDNFATIVAAVEEGRTIFTNIRKSLRYLLSSNIGEVLTMFLGVLMAGTLGLAGGTSPLALPLLATQLLWINLLTDSAPALALGVAAGEPRAMFEPPRPRSEGVITRAMWWSMSLYGLAMASITLLVLDASLPGGFLSGSGSIAYAQTRAFTTLVLCQLFNALNAQAGSESVFCRPFANPWLWAALAASSVLQLAVVYLPPFQRAFSTTALGLQDWLVCAVLASGVLWLGEASKLLQRALRRAPTA